MSRNEPFTPRCPTCDMAADPVAASKYLPFCSERCRLIDLGRWLNEEHSLPSEPNEEEEEAETQASAPPRLPPGWHDP